MTCCGYNPAHYNASRARLSAGRLRDRVRGLVIAPGIGEVELGISARRAILTMANDTGDIRILDNVDT